jgi:hypothetical protein
MPFGIGTKEPQGHGEGEHPANCFHCGRPENTEPFVIEGTPIELYSSEGDLGRWRHWGGSDQWLCRDHRYYVGGGPLEGHDPAKFYRLMEDHEAAEHATLHGHGLVDEARERESLLREALFAAESQPNPRLAALDRSAPSGGHAGRNNAGGR